MLTEVYKLDTDRLYVTIFEGDNKEGLPKDEEAYNEWKKVIAEDRILLGNKKDNFGNGRYRALRTLHRNTCGLPDRCRKKTGRWKNTGEQ